MDKAKAAVSEFISKSGQHDTSVHERVDPTVTKQTINPHQREERQIATDREVHQDHYHTTVQPIHDREVLPEQHHHNLVPVEHRTHDNRDTTDTETKLRTARAQHKDESIRTETQHTSQTMPTVTGEHVHHHIHETIQPVIHKETIEPHVMHTTVPIHEVHHNKPQHHAASALPAMSMEDFKKGGGALQGREERVDHFKGEPKNIERSLAGGSAGLRDSGISTGTGGLSHSGVGSEGTRSELGHNTSSGHHGIGGAAATGAGVAGGALAGEKLASHRDHTGAAGATDTSGMTGTSGPTSSSGMTSGSHRHGAGTAAATAAGVGGGALAGEKLSSHGQHQPGNTVSGNQGLGSTATTNTGGIGARDAVSGMTGSPHDTKTSTGSEMTGSRVAAGGAGATTVGGIEQKARDTITTSTGMAGSHGTSQASGVTGSTTGKGMGEFGHRHDGQHPTTLMQGGKPTNVTSGTGSSATGLGSKTGSTRKPSLMDRLNPKKDADGDGKAGFLS